MKTFYKEYSESIDMVVPYSIERSFNLNVGGVKLRGKIDRIDSYIEDGVEVKEIIDYKTGDKVRKQTEVNKDKQLVIYALAAEKVFGISVDKLSLLFIDQNTKISADMTKINKMKEKVIEEIVETANKIDQGDFTATPGFLCRYCDYRNICKYADL